MTIDVRNLPSNILAPVVDMSAANANDNPLASLNLGPAPQPAPPTAPVASSAPNSSPNNDYGQAESGSNALSGTPGNTPARGGVSSSFGSQIAAAAEKIGIPPGVGGWARSLVGAAQSALAGAGAVGKVPPGAGALYGAGKAAQYMGEQKAAAQARQDKLNQQAQENARANNAAADEHQYKLASIAHENINTYHDQKLVQKMTEQDEDARDQSITTGKSALEPYLSGKYAVSPVAEDVPSSQIQSMLAKNHIKGAEHHVFATGKQEIPGQKDPLGNPVYETTYTIVPDAAQVEVDDKNLALINKFTDKDYKPGQTLEGHQYGTVIQQATSTQTAVQAINRDRKNAGEEPLTDSEIKDSASLLSDWNQKLAKTGNDPLAAMNAFLADPDTAKKYPYAAGTLVSMYGGQEGWADAIQTRKDTAEDQKQRLLDKANSDKTLTKLETDPAEMAGDKSESAIAMAQSRLNDPTTPVNQKARWNRILTQAKVSADLSGKAKAAEKAAEAAAQEVAKNGDPKSGGALLASHTASPEQLRARSNPEYLRKAIAEAQLIDPTFNAQKADADFRIAGNQNNTTFFGSANSLVDPNGTLDQLTDQIKNLPANTTIPKFNSLANWTAAAVGNGPLSGYASTALGVADDYSKVMGGGVGTDSARDQALNLIDAQNSLKGKAQAINGIRQAVNSQRRARIGRNPILQSMYGDESTIPAKKPNQVQNAEPKVVTIGGNKITTAADGTFNYNGKMWKANPDGKGATVVPTVNK